MADEMERVEAAPAKRSAIGIVLQVFFALGVLAVLALGVFFYRSLQPMNPAATGTIQLKVEPGSSTISVAEKLEQTGVINNARVFQIYSKYLKLDSKLKAGQYNLGQNMSMAEILKVLTAGQVDYVSFTIPEGYNLKQIAKRLTDKGIVTEADFWQQVEVGQFYYQFMQQLPAGPQRLEGFLFPDTYKVNRQASAHEVLDMMLKRFQQVIGPDYEALANQNGLTLYQAVTLAAIVEREASVDVERPVVAGVFYNRLAKNIKLESCATVQYALGEVKPRLLYKDLAIDSPYNTYKVNGLPVGPIAAPGKASLMAVVHPEKHDYLFFVVSKDGQHVFSRTLAEHNKAKQKYVARFEIKK